MTRTHRTPIVAAVAATAAAAAVGAGASAQGPAGRTLTVKELERGATFAHIRNTKPPSRRANMAGDLIVFTNPIADSAGRRIGKLHVSCTTTIGARNFMRSTLTCSGVMALRDGTLALQATTTPNDAVTTGAVTGGTGSYANARGVYVSRADEGGSTATITLAG